MGAFSELDFGFRMSPVSDGTFVVGVDSEFVVYDNGRLLVLVFYFMLDFVVEEKCRCPLYVLLKICLEEFTHVRTLCKYSYMLSFRGD